MELEKVLVAPGKVVDDNLEIVEAVEVGTYSVEVEGVVEVGMAVEVEGFVEVCGTVEEGGAVEVEGVVEVGVTVEVCGAVEVDGSVEVVVKGALEVEGMAVSGTLVVKKETEVKVVAAVGNAVLGMAVENIKSISRHNLIIYHQSPTNLLHNLVQSSPPDRHTLHPAYTCHAGKPDCTNQFAQFQTLRT